MTPHEVQQRKSQIRELAMYGWYFVCSLTDEQFDAAWNGCGPDSWPAERREKLTRWLSTFALAFDGHDCRFAYDNDGTREKFDYANDELEKNCILLADEKYAWYNPLRYFARNRGHIIGALCREFGWSAWRDAFAKNQNKKG